MMIAGVPQSLVVEPGPSAASAAREHTRLACAGVTSQGQADAVTLVVSELVTNAVRYSHGQVRLVLRVSRGEVFVAVQDTGSGFAVMPLAADPLLEGGRGLFIVAAIANCWGVESLAAAGKLVWCVVDAQALRYTERRATPAVPFLLGSSDRLDEPGEQQPVRLVGVTTA